MPEEAVLMAAGLQVPVMLLVEAAGKAGGVLPWQRVPTGSKVGVIRGSTYMEIVVEVAHRPVLGVKA